jgi:hypothetical protein
MDGGHGREWPFPRFLDRMAPASATKYGERDGWAIFCAYSGHDRGRLVLALVTSVNLNENESARPRERESVSFSFEQFANRNCLESRSIKTKYRHNILKAACSMHRRKISAF